ncbi:MAG: hypothetical protein KKE20_02895 [Nanoarchaeota archaeon]|nr:hypothetical protein [Nanoarchaeota archaeon]
MLERNVLGVKVSVPDNIGKSPLYDSKIAPFLGSPDLKQLLMQVKEEAPNHPDKIMVVLGDGVVMAESNGRAAEYCFEIYPYSSQKDLAGALHGILVAQARKRQDDTPIKIYSTLDLEQRAEALRSFTDLPMIEGNLNTGVFDENILRCPVMYALFGEPRQIRKVYFLCESPDCSRSTAVTESVWEGKDGVLFQYNHFIDGVPVEEAKKKYLKASFLEERAIAIRVPTLACLADACAPSRQQFTYPMDENTKIESRFRCIPPPDEYSVYK